AGISDELGRLCLSVAFWNERDPILKERLFGLTNSEGNHGEDVKELYYYLDAVPSHSYLRMLYKYPQSEFPYARLVAESRSRGPHDAELELVDTGIFDDDRYFDCEVVWAKAAPDDLLLRISVHNAGREPAAIHVLPQIWFRNTWSFGKASERPSLRLDGRSVYASHAELGSFRFDAEDPHAHLLFTENDTNPRLWGRTGDGHYKDAFHERVVGRVEHAVNPVHAGTKACFWQRDVLAPGATRVFRFRLHRGELRPFDEFEAIVAERLSEADAFYDGIAPDEGDPERRRVLRQALAGLLWSKQLFYFDVREWLRGDPGQPAPPPSRRHGRNSEWEHLNNADVISMPDKWEYPWYAAWDLAFHCVPLALVDIEFAKSQLQLLTREWYMHPNGQLPAYEWAFGDVNPPVHAWATWKVYQLQKKLHGTRDRAFLESVFHKLMLNFTWWVNRKDAGGRNIFQGGFLGLDNIGVFDRSAPLPTGGHLDQADGTSWMAAYSLHLMRIALELARDNPVYEDIATKFFEHFLHIAEAMTNMGGRGVGLWDDGDGFYYDALHLEGGHVEPLKIRSMVGLLPLAAVEVLEPEDLEAVPAFRARLEWFLRYRPDLAGLVSRWNEPGRGDRRLLSLLRGSRMKRILRRLLDEREFLSPYGVRALSKHHEEHPYVFRHGGVELSVGYLPAESTSGLFGGNSNWRGPIWFPVNFLLIDALRGFHRYYGDEFRVECPTGSGRFVTIDDAANDIAERLVKLFLPREDGVRPHLEQHPKVARDPRFRDHLQFYEYFHGDTGRGVGASHQTGWTGLVASLIAGLGADGR
ncbi:MAG: glucosidase, partial [Deltaproteobacteria bacterium]|nr:glucosidase [Deltaproteobacteria bacterium]